MSSSDFPESNSPSSGEPGYQNRLLAIDGGGIRGWVAIPILKKLEQELAGQYPEETDFRLCHYFNFVGGTSVGAILAALIAIGKSMTQIEEIFEQSSKKMFASSKLWMLRHKYGRSNVEKTLKKHFKDMRLGDEEVETLLFLMLRNASTGSNWPLTNNPQAKYNRVDRSNCNLAFPLWKLVRASTAAPTFFPVESIEVSDEHHEFIDGCMSPYNNPAFAMFLHAVLPEYRMQMGSGTDRMLIVSVGTGSDEPVYQPGQIAELSMLGGADLAVKTFLHANGVEQDVLCRVFGDYLNDPGSPIDREVDCLFSSDDTGSLNCREHKKFSYLRYNPHLSTRQERDKKIRQVKAKWKQKKWDLRQAGADKAQIRAEEELYKQDLAKAKSKETDEDHFRKRYPWWVMKKQPFAIDAVRALEVYRNIGEKYAKIAVLRSHFDRFCGPLHLGRRIVDGRGEVVDLPHQVEKKFQQQNDAGETVTVRRDLPVKSEAQARQAIAAKPIVEIKHPWRTRSNNALILGGLSIVGAVWLGLSGGLEKWAAHELVSFMGLFNLGPAFAACCLLSLVAVVSGIALRWVPRKRLALLGAVVGVAAMVVAMFVRSWDFWSAIPEWFTPPEPSAESKDEVSLLSRFGSLVYQLVYLLYQLVYLPVSLLVSLLFQLFTLLSELLSSRWFSWLSWDHWLPGKLRGFFSLLMLVSLSGFVGALVTFATGWDWIERIRIDKSNQPEEEDEIEALPELVPQPELVEAATVSMLSQQIAARPVDFTRPLVIPLDPDQGITMSFQPIPAGSFRMGSYGGSHDEQPVHLVTIPEPFFQGTFPVTQEQFAVWTGEHLSEHENAFPGNPRHPAEMIHWRDAMQFCRWLNELDCLPSGWMASLPDEARWEYACRAEERNDGSIISPEYYTGNGIAALDRAGWFSENANGQTHPVGEKEANRWGVHDMHGNVWEWCLDKYEKDAYRKNTGVALELCDFSEGSGADAGRVMRGGSWDGTAGNTRSSSRYWFHPRIRLLNYGFRVCLVPVRQKNGEALKTGRLRDEARQKVRGADVQKIDPRSGRNF